MKVCKTYFYIWSLDYSDRDNLWCFSSNFIIHLNLTATHYNCKPNVHVALVEIDIDEFVKQIKSIAIKKVKHDKKD